MEEMAESTSSDIKREIKETQKKVHEQQEVESGAEHKKHKKHEKSFEDSFKSERIG